MPIEQAIGIANRNSERFQATIKSRAAKARGHFIDVDGNRRHFDFDAALLIHVPRCMRLDMSVLGSSRFIFGSNDEKYWVIEPAPKVITWGRHDGAIRPLEEDLILRPDLVTEALGMTPLPEETAGAPGPVQRITPDFQQLLFIGYHDDSQHFITKEYWLSRFEPRLVSRIIFRDGIGRTVMDSRLGAYKPIDENGPYLPHRIEVEWPTSDGYLLFTCSGWQQLPLIDKTHSGFVCPLDRGETFSRVVDLTAP